MENEDEFIAVLGVRIQQLRHGAGYTQADMAQRLGCGLRNYQRLETGLTNCTLRTLIRIALALGLTPADLLQVPRRRAPLQLTPRQPSPLPLKLPDPPKRHRRRRGRSSARKP